jgi:hypothetical protein
MGLFESLSFVGIFFVLAGMFSVQKVRPQTYFMAGI